MTQHHANIRFRPFLKLFLKYRWSHSYLMEMVRMAGKPRQRGKQTGEDLC